jgi:hypothetical protein
MGTISGYEILKKQTSQSVSWLRAARTDLAVVYEALQLPVKAEKFRAELAEAEARK